MSILSGFKKYKNYKTDSNGDHQLQSFWTSSDTVQNSITEAGTRSNLADGETLSTSLGKVKKYFTDLGTAAFKDTTNSYSSTGEDPVTGKAIAAALGTLPNPMVMKGTLGAQADNPTITALPVDGSADKGDTYKVITDGTYASVAAKVGDFFTCTSKTSDANTWCHVPAGDDSIVIANPTGTATDEMFTISIDGVIYDVIDATALHSDEVGTAAFKDINNEYDPTSEDVATGQTIDDALDSLGSQVATGNPLTITDASPIKAEQMVFGIEPIQDLHGYDKPWVGGAWKNKLPLTVAGIKAANTGGTWSGNVYTRNGGTFTITTDNDNNVIGIIVNGQFSVVTWFLLGTPSIETGNYALNGCPSGGGYDTYRITNGDQTFKDDGNGVGGILSSEELFIRVAATTVSNKIFQPMLRSASEADATFAPYSNISPITGLSEVSGGTCGKNLIDPAKITESANHVNGYAYSDGDGLLVDAGPYTLSVSQECNGLYVSEAVEGASSIAYVNNSNKLTFTIPSKMYIKMQSWRNSGVTGMTYQLEKGTVTTPTYEPYQSHTTTIQLGQTVYGGTLTLNADGSAWCYVDRTFIDLSTMASSIEFSSGLNCWVVNVTETPKSYGSDGIPQNMISSVGYNPQAYSSDKSQNAMGVDLWGHIFVGNGSSTTKPIGQIVYELATPFTLHLTAEQLQLLENLNNISTNAKTLTVKYQPNNAIGEAKIYANEAAEIVAKEYTTESDTVDTDIYLYRASQNSGDRCYLRQLVGASFGVNQLFNVANPVALLPRGITLNVNATTGAITISGTSTGLAYFQWTDVNCPQNHVIYATNGLGKDDDRFSFYNDSNGVSTNNKESAIGRSTNSAGHWTLRIASGASFGNGVTIYPQIIDLTQWFNSQIADYAETAGFSWLRNQGHFTESYYPYSTGSLQSVNTSGKVCGGKNLLKKYTSETYNGVSFVTNIDGSVSVKGTATSTINKDVIINEYELPYSDSYTLSGSPSGGGASSYQMWIYDMTISSALSGEDTGSGATIVLDRSHKYSVRIRVASGYTIDKTFYPMLKLASVTDDTYEPYTTHTTPISPIDLRGVPQLVDNNIIYDGDIMDESGVITRKYKRYNLGDYTWTKGATSSGKTNWSTSIPDIKKVDSETAFKGICPKFISVSQSATWTPYIMSLLNNSTSLYVTTLPDEYADAKAFKTAMNGVYLDVEIETPYTEQTTPIQNPVIYNQFGWEQFIDNRDYPIPVGHNSEYVNLPDWMETGYVDDLRDRVDYDIPKDIERLSDGIFSKNLLPMTVESVKRVNTNATWTGNKYCFSGENYGFELMTNDSVNINGIRVWSNGTVSGSSLTLFLAKSGKYFNQFSGCVLSGCNLNDENKGYIEIRRYESPWTYYAKNTVGDTVINEIPEEAFVEVSIYIKSDSAFDQVIYPMIRKQGEDNTYKLAMPTIQTLLNMYAELETRVKILETS